MLDDGHNFIPFSFSLRHGNNNSKEGDFLFFFFCVYRAYKLHHAVGVVSLQRYTTGHIKKRIQLSTNLYNDALVVFLSFFFRLGVICGRKKAERGRRRCERRRNVSSHRVSLHQKELPTTTGSWLQGNPISRRRR